jgi:hypothetical protein
MEVGAEVVMCWDCIYLVDSVVVSNASMGTPEQSIGRIKRIFSDIAPIEFVDYTKIKVRSGAGSPLGFICLSN